MYHHINDYILPLPHILPKGITLMKTAIVTDSNCGIAKKEADSLGIFVIPMPVCMNDTFYHEGIDLDYLKRGGRITPAAASMASILNIKPLLTVGENKVDAYEKVRGQKRSFQMMSFSMIH
jgi:fatty acid-binding protein DegV